jgi:Arc/MetJ-type ribon-helix-helix transcriptional regulator
MAETLSPEVEQLVREHIDGRQFTSANQVLVVALHLFKEYRHRYRDRLSAEIKEGFDQLERGEGIEFDEDGLEAFFKDLLAEAEQDLVAEAKDAA